MKIGIYIRVSTQEQVQEGYSISAQTQRLKAYCIAQDWTVSGIYIDEGISAKSMKRPRLQAMIQDIKDGKIDCVLVYRLDRLTRSVLDLYQLLTLFDEYDCKFKSATEVYDTTTAMGRLFITIIGALAQWERENTGERISMGLMEKVRQGKYAINFSPYGYDLNDGELSVNEVEAKNVRKMYKLYLEGLGANRICKHLNERGITTKGGNQWTNKSVMEILKNPLYIGTIRWHRNRDEPILVENSVPAIIDLDQFEEVQETISRRTSISPRAVSSDYLFSGVVRCPSCSRIMIGYPVYHKDAKGNKVTYRNYRCKYKKIGACKDSKSVSERALEKAFIQSLGSINFDEEIAAAAEDTTLRTGEVVDVGDIERELEQIQKRKKKWQYAWANDTITDLDFNDRMNEERTREKELTEQLGGIEQPQEATISKEDMIRYLQNIEDNWNRYDRSEKKNFIQSYVEYIEVEREGKALKVHDIGFQ